LVIKQKAIETYEGVLHRLNGFLLDLTAVYGKGRLQVPLGLLISLAHSWSKEILINRFPLPLMLIQL
jgi:hypothetical protein